VRRRLLLVLVATLCTAAAAGAAPGRLAGDPLQGQEWWLHDIGADQAGAPGPGVPITVIDGGVDASHPELVGRPDTTFLNDQTVDGPSDFHATAVASLAAAPENGIGLVGVYPQAALQVWDASPSGSGISAAAAAAGIAAAGQRCPGVINLSFAGTDPDPQLQDAILAAVHDGCLVVAAAGNDAGQGDPVTYPAAFPHVLTVGSTDEQDAAWPFSTSGRFVDLAAPGVDMVAAVPVSDDPSGYSSGLAGTSFSAPLVAAAAAWIWTVRPTLDASQLADVLRRSARDVGPPGFDPQTGFGILDIPAALALPEPPRDSPEPNDDVDQVKPGELFADGQPALTTAEKPSNRVAGTLDVAEDPRDLYRIWVPPRRIVRVSVAAAGDAAARIWGPRTVAVGEGLAARRRDLKGPSLAAGKSGLSAYVEVLLTGASSTARYTLSVRASRR
jgi:subtilisin family serine protease